MPENQVKKLYKRMKLTEREVANFLDISRGKLRKALNSDQPPMWFERHNLVSDAIAQEKTMKGWPRQWKINLIERNNPNWDEVIMDYDD